jgi:hypothetical protein
MDITIGVQHIARDISIETEESAEAITGKVTEAINSDGLLSLTDTKGRVVLVPASKIAYIDLGPATGRRVGFGK